jgi:hypothetical protein
MDNLEILAGMSLPLPEQDDPDQNQLNYEASVEYDGAELVSAIGQPDFKEIYTMFINDLKQMEIVDQRRLCLDILAKVKEVYNYSFLPYPELDSQVDMNDVYDLIKFLNYEHLDFFSDIWKYLKVDLKKVDIKKFCYENSDKIVSELEDQINSRDLSRLVSLFLRTYIKDDLIDWFVDATEKNRMLIYLRILEKTNEQGV